MLALPAELEPATLCLEEAQYKNIKVLVPGCRSTTTNPGQTRPVVRAIAVNVSRRLLPVFGFRPM